MSLHSQSRSLLFFQAFLLFFLQSISSTSMNAMEYHIERIFSLLSSSSPPLSSSLSGAEIETDFDGDIEKIDKRRRDKTNDHNDNTNNKNDKREREKEMEIEVDHHGRLYWIQDDRDGLCVGPYGMAPCGEANLWGVRDSNRDKDVKGDVDGDANRKRQLYTLEHLSFEKITSSSSSNWLNADSTMCLDRSKNRWNFGFSSFFLNGNRETNIIIGIDENEEKCQSIGWSFSTDGKISQPVDRKEDKKGDRDRERGRYIEKEEMCMLRLEDNSIVGERCEVSYTNFSLLEYIPYSKQYIKDRDGEILILEEEIEIERAVEIGVEVQRGEGKIEKKTKEMVYAHHRKIEHYHHYHSMSSGAPIVPMPLAPAPAPVTQLEIQKRSLTSKQREQCGEENEESERETEREIQGEIEIETKGEREGSCTTTFYSFFSSLSIPSAPVHVPSFQEENKEGTLNTLKKKSILPPSIPLTKKQVDFEEEQKEEENRGMTNKEEQIKRREQNLSFTGTAVDASSGIPLATDMSPFLGKRGKNQVLIGSGAFKFFGISIYGVGYYIDIEEAAKSTRLQKYQGKSIHELQQDENFYGDMMAKEDAYDRSLYLKLQLPLKASMVKASLEAEWNMDPENKRELLDDTFRHLGDCCSRGSELLFTWLKNGNLEVRLDNNLIETFYRTALAEDLFLQYVCEDPISIPAKKGFVTRFPKLLQEGASSLVDENLQTLEYNPTTPDTKAKYMKKEQDAKDTATATAAVDSTSTWNSKISPSTSISTPSTPISASLSPSHDLINTIVTKVKNNYLKYWSWKSGPKGSEKFKKNENIEGRDMNQYAQYKSNNSNNNRNDDDINIVDGKGRRWRKRPWKSLKRLSNKESPRVYPSEKGYEKQEQEYEDSRGWGKKRFVALAVGAYNVILILSLPSGVRRSVVDRIQKGEGSLTRGASKTSVVQQVSEYIQKIMTGLLSIVRFKL